MKIFRNLRILVLSLAASFLVPATFLAEAGTPHVQPLVKELPKKSFLKVITYNTHGGHGDLTKNLARFKALLDGDEHVLCLQEIGPDIWEQVVAAFPEFRYSYKVWQKTTDELYPGEKRQIAGGGILSKLPIIEKEEGLIQIDPGGDLWERRAGFVKIQTGKNPDTDFIYLGHYHNTYNWDIDSFRSEKAGMVQFRKWSLEQLEASDLSTKTPYILAGDWNLFEKDVTAILSDAPYYYHFWRDYQHSNLPMLRKKWINTLGNDISDHNAVSVTYSHKVTWK